MKAHAKDKMSSPSLNSVC